MQELPGSALNLFLVCEELIYSFVQMPYLIAYVDYFPTYNLLVGMLHLLAVYLLRQILMLRHPLRKHLQPPKKYLCSIRFSLLCLFAKPILFCCFRYSRN
jgi:hypothetical protein